MASYLNPKPSNSIVSDLTEIRELSNYNAKADPSLGTDAPIGAKRFAKITTGQYRWEELTNTGWVAIAPDSTSKLMHNVDMLDGYHASTSAVKNTVPVYNANAQLVGSITGNAATATKLQNARNIQLGGIVSSTAQSFNGTAAITIPVNSVTINNDADNAVVGVLTTAHGGTGRTDGVASDIIVDSFSGEVKAKAYGQVGQLPLKAVGTDLDSMVVDGRYFVRATDGEGCHHPKTENAFASLIVESCGNYCVQKYDTLLADNKGASWIRFSNNKGSSWGGWIAKHGTTSGDLKIYISKSGSDLNTGLSSSYPVLTFTRALQIARSSFSNTHNNVVHFCVGAGDWDTLNLVSLPYHAKITAYSGGGITDEGSIGDIPHFTTISVSSCWVNLNNVRVDLADAVSNGYITFTSGGISKVSRFRARYMGTIEFGSPTILITNAGASLLADSVFRAYRYGHFIIQSDAKFRVTENISVSSSGAFCFLSSGATFDDAGFAITVDSGVTVSGASLRVNSNGFYFGNGNEATKYPGSTAVFDESAWSTGLYSDKFVHSTGAETISGIKTFTSNVCIANGSSPELKIINTSIKTGVNPSSNEYHVLRFEDADGTSLGVLAHQTYTSGGARSYLTCPSRVGGATALLEVLAPASGGSPYATAPTTPDGAISNTIVTADWLYKRGLAETTVYANYDPDTLVKTGYYQVRNDQGKLPSGSNGCLLVYTSGSVVRQIFFRQGTIDSNDHNIFTRQLGGMVDGVPTQIGAWVRILTNKYIALKNTQPLVQELLAGVVKGTPPASNVFGGLAICEEGGNDTKNRIAALSGVYYADGGTRMGLHAYKPTADSTVNAAVEVHYPATGTPYGTAPTPDATSNTNHIATTLWVRERMSERSKWTYKASVLVEAAHEIGTYTLNFSSYLPNDGEDYEVLLNIYCSTSTDTTTNSVLFVYTPGNTKYIQVEAEGKNFEQNTNTALLPVSSTRTIKYEVSAYSFEKIIFRVAGYRKA